MTMELDLSGKVAVVTGASRGIGLAVTRSLAEEGAFVVAGALNGSQELDLLGEKFEVHAVRVDLTEAGGPQHLVAQAISRAWRTSTFSSTTSAPCARDSTASWR